MQVHITSSVLVAVHCTKKSPLSQQSTTHTYVRTHSYTTALTSLVSIPDTYSKVQSTYNGVYTYIPGSSDDVIILHAPDTPHRGRRQANHLNTVTFYTCSNGGHASRLETLLNVTGQKSVSRQPYLNEVKQRSFRPAG